MIVKIQRALFPPGAPALIYSQSRDFMTEMPLGALPPDVRAALDKSPKVYWNAARHPGRRGPLLFRTQAEPQEW
jgi:hypothetical protein